MPSTIPIVLSDGSIRLRSRSDPKPETLEDLAQQLSKCLGDYENSASALAQASSTMAKAEREEEEALGSVWLTDQQVENKCAYAKRAKSVFAAQDEQTRKTADALDSATEAFYNLFSNAHRSAMNQVRESLHQPIRAAAQWPEHVSPSALNSLEGVVQQSVPVMRMASLKPSDLQQFAPGRPGYFIRGGRTAVGLARDLLQLFREFTTERKS
jgi:hypothetical protein